MKARQLSVSDIRRALAEAGVGKDRATVIGVTLRLPPMRPGCQEDVPIFTGQRIPCGSRVRNLDGSIDCYYCDQHRPVAQASS